jgi:hypothetical protein
MPEPIIDPTTIAVEEKRPRLCTSPVALAGTLEAEMGFGSGVFTQSKFYRISAQLSFFF